MAPTNGVSDQTKSVLPHFTAKFHHEPYDAILPTRPELSAAGKVVVVTGSASGIGKATATAFVQAGAKALVILDRNQGGLFKTKQELQALGTTEIHPFVINITDADGVREVFNIIESTIGKIDVLSNGAGVLPLRTPLEEFDVEDWWKGFEINVKGSMIVVQNFLKHCTPTATLVNISSVLAHYGVKKGYLSGHTSYAASKIAFTKVMEIVQTERPELKIVNIHPGMVATPLSARAGKKGVHVDTRKEDPFSLSSLPQSPDKYCTTPCAYAFPTLTCLQRSSQPPSSSGAPVPRPISSTVDWSGRTGTSPS